MPTARLITTLLCLSVYPALSADNHILTTVKSGEALIERDRWGIPHIYGQSMTAVAFGAGYAQAEDHLDFMLRLFLKARGELGRIEGSSALNGDVLQRTLMHRELAERTWNAAPQSSREYYQAFADGINRYMDTHPEEKQPWHWKIDALDIDGYMRFTVISFGYQVAMGKVQGRSGESAEGSNAYAISASRSSSGHAMLHGDPHLAWSGDHRFGYEMHLKCPQFDIAGTGYIGEPIPMIGHNADVAWTATNNAANTADAFEEKIDPKDPDRYLDSDGQWKTMEKRTVRIEVRQPDGSMKSVEKVLRYTSRGPFVESHGHGYSLAIARWRDFPDILTGSILRAQARNLDDFRAALTTNPFDKWNLIYADRQGNAYYVDNGVFPKRANGYNYNKPVPGWEPAAQWSGYVPFRDLPQITNPPNGVIVQCNNSPYSTAQPPVIDPANYSPYLVHSSEVTALPNSRDARAFALFAEHPKVSWDDFRQAAFDVKVLHVGPVYDAVLKASEGQTDPDLREVHSILSQWDGMASIETRALPILRHWEMIAQQQKVRSAELSNCERCLDILKQTVAEMKRLYGTVSVPLGDVQTFSHGKDYPVAGHDSLFVSRANYKDGKWHAYMGSSWMFVIEFSTPLKAFTIAPLGESDHPSSPHFADQTAMFSKRELKPFPFADDEVKSLVESSYRLKM